MAFVVKKPVEAEIEDVEVVAEEFTYKPLNLKITIKSFEDEMFVKAYEKIGERQILEFEKLKQAPLDYSFFDDLDTRKDKGSVGGLVIKAVGRYLIADWDVNDEDGNKLPVTGENFELLMANIGVNDQMPFLQWCMDRAGDVALEEAKRLNDIKKKPLTATSGKRTTKTSAPKS